MHEYIVVWDVETTGLNSKEDFIIQLAMIKFEKESFEVISKKNWYIKPAHNYTINPQAQEKHGISKEWLDKNGIYYFGEKPKPPVNWKDYKKDDIKNFNLLIV